MNLSYAIVSQNTQIIEDLKSELECYELFRLAWQVGNQQECFDKILYDLPNIIFVDLDNYHVENPMLMVREFADLECPSPRIIAISSNKKLAYDCIKVGVFDFLLNPLSKYELRKSLNKATIYFQEKKSKICLKANSDYQFLDLADILYLQADNNYTDFYLSCGKRITGFDSLKKFEKLLPKEFLRIHKSYIINSEQVSRINFGKSRITLKKTGMDLHIPFSNKYKNSVKIFNDHMLHNHFSSMAN